MNKKLGLLDIYSVAVYGIKARKGRSIMTSIGIGIGIAAIVAVIGISQPLSSINQYLINSY